MTLSEQLQALSSCSDAVEWCEGKTIKEAWGTSDRGDWMLWLAEKMAGKEGWPDKRQWVGAAVRCARLVQHLMTDQRSLDALDVGERYSRDEATKEDLAAAGAAAGAAVWATSGDAEVAAAWAAVWAASGDASGAAAWAAAGSASGAATLKQCADICRETLTIPEEI